MGENEPKCSKTLGDSKEESPKIPGYASVEEFTKEGFKTLVEAIKHSGALPSGRDWDFYNTSQSFKEIINNESDNITQLLNKVMRCNDLETNIRNRILDEKIELVIEANDIILEKVANNIDELNGIRKSVAAPVILQTVSAELPVNGSWNRVNSATFSVNSTVAKSNKNCIKLLTAKNIIRPQKFFKDKIDNRNNVSWCPRIKDKPNSLKPLAIFLEESEFGEEYSHPYEYELDRFVPTAEQLKAEKPELSKPLSETPLIEIDNIKDLEELVNTLRTCTEFAVDVEHHSYRTFMGITCLLQISTKDKDYIIDTLALRDQLHILNEVFTKNSIVKIFHGADNDIQWLQRDLSIYVVNMFDTHQAAKVLQYPALSLAFLLKKFCNIAPNKQYQLADWRIRPLPDELKNYAREDTHFLIYIYQMLKQELLAKGNKDNLLKSAIERSTDLCKKRYLKPILTDTSHLELYRKCKKMFDNRQMYALKEIYAWRDQLAREEDESLGFVLPNHMLMQIAETLPREMQGILACCNPIPPLVRSHLLELHQIILKAREQPLEKAILKDTSGRGILKKVSKVNVEGSLHCPHDLSKAAEFRDDLPTLLQNEAYKTQNKDVVEAYLPLEKAPSYSVFKDSNEHKFNERLTFKKLRGFAYFSPYERYKLVKPFVVAENEAEAQKEVKENEEEKKSASGKSQERSDEDRIESIKDHFVQLSKKFSEELQIQKQKEEEEEKRQLREKSLLQMGGSRKRRRDDTDFGFVEDRTPNFETPAPDNYGANQFYGARKGKGRKRKFKEQNSFNDGQNEEPPKPKRRKRNRNFNRANQQNFNNQQNQQNYEENDQPSFKQKQNKNKQKSPKNMKQQNPGKQQNYQNNQGQKGKNPPQNARKNSPKKQQNTPNKQNFPGTQQSMGNNPRNNKQLRSAQRAKQYQQQNDNFAPFDYSSVDFRQFQSGAGSASTNLNITHKFKGKQNRKNHSKRGAKAATFTNSAPRRGGRQNRNY